MRTRSDLAEIIARLAAEPPHIADFGRRRLIAGAGRFGLGAAAMAALTRGLAFAPAAAAEAVRLPGITNVPANLKGSGEVRVCSWGGALQAGQRRAYFEPFERLCGIKVVECEGPDPVKVKAMVDTGNVEYDVAEVDRSSVINLQKKGSYWESIDYSLCDTAHIDAAFRHQYALGMLPYAQMMAYRTDAFPKGAPAGWEQFWDAKAFPGARTMAAGSSGLRPELEFAAMASGVPVDQVYPIEIDKAYASLGKIKSHVVKWWTAGAMPAQMLTDKEVVLATAWNGRIAAIQAAGAPVAINWHNGMLLTDTWAVPKGAKDASNAMKFIAFTTMPISQARLSMLLPYGFVNNEAVKYIPASRLDQLPTAPVQRKQLLIYDTKWWADNRDAVVQKWASWVLG